MDGLLIRDFLGAQEQKVVIRVRVEMRGIRERVVIRDGKKLVAVPLVPGHQIPR